MPDKKRLQSELFDLCCCSCCAHSYLTEILTNIQLLCNSGCFEKGFVAFCCTGIVANIRLRFDVMYNKCHAGHNTLQELLHSSQVICDLNAI